MTTPPHSLEAERAVLGGILLAPKQLAEVAAHASPADFYHPSHAAVFEAMQALDAAGIPLDAITVAQQLSANRDGHKLRALGGEAWAAELTSAVVTTENLGYHARIVHGKALVRRLIEASQAIAAAGYADPEAAEYIADAEKQVSAIAMDAAGGAAEYKHIRTVLKDTFASVEKRYEQKQVVTGVPWGWEALDTLTGGMHPGQLLIVGGRPKSGKTSLAMGAVEHATTGANINRAQVPTLVISLEMVAEELGTRLASSHGGIDGTRLRNGFLEQGDWIRFARSAGELSKAPLHVFDGSATFSRIRSMARRWRARETKPGELALLVVDYLQLIASDSRGKNWNREQEVAGWSRGFKQLAKELGIPVLLLAQLNRDADKRTDKRPIMSDLRESGAIEADADLVLLVYRDEVHNADSPLKGIAEVIIGAGRHVPTGTVHLRFQGEYTRFSDCPPGDVPAREPKRQGRRNGYHRGTYTPDPEA
jgi:replicative DNA helicase